MHYCRVDGNIVATIAHPSLKGTTQLICQPLDDNGEDNGLPIVAFDPLGAGRGDLVIVTSDGKSIREKVRNDLSPLRFMVIQIVDPKPHAEAAG